MRDNLTVPSVQTIPVVPLDRLRFADHLQAGDVVGWPQGPGEPLALTEALVAQRHALEDCALLFGLTQSGTLRPELVDAFRLHALNGAGTSRRVTSSAEIFPCHVSSIPGLLRSGRIRLDVALTHVRPVGAGRYSLGVIADFTQAMIESGRVGSELVNPALPALVGDALVRAEDIDVLVERDERIIEMQDPEPSDLDRAVAAN